MTGEGIDTDELFGLDALGREVLPIVDSTRAHARAAAALALGGD